MFKTIDDNLLDKVFQRIVDVMARRNMTVPGMAPFTIAMFFFIGSMVLLLTSCVANFVEGVLGGWWLVAVLPMLGSVMLRRHVIEQVRAIAGLSEINPLRWSMLHTRIFMLVMLLFLLATLVLRGLHTTTLLLWFTAICDYWLGLNFMACRVPPVPSAAPPPPGGPWIAP